MPTLLAHRIDAAGDSVERFERAARRRFAEAEILRTDAQRHLGAVYLYGYCVEMWLKACCYRSLGFSPSQRIMQSDRRTVEALVKAFAPPNIPVGHYIPGWASLFIAKKAGLPPHISIEVANNANAVYIRWRETFRYAPNQPSQQEVLTVYDKAAWFKQKYPRTLR